MVFKVMENCLENIYIYIYKITVFYSMGTLVAVLHVIQKQEDPWKTGILCLCILATATSDLILGGSGQTIVCYHFFKLLGVSRLSSS